jgi:hypothetical protein
MLGINPIWYFRNFSIEEYEKLSEKELQILRKEYYKLKKEDKYTFDKIENVHERIATYIQKTLDKKYTPGNYTVIIIGRSMSSIGKVLGYKIGEENVINIPMSNARKFLDPEKIKEISQTKEMDSFLKFLKHLGLSKEDVENSGKQYVLTDYCYTGFSLEGANCLLKSIWENPKNLISKDFMMDWAIKNEQEVILNDFARSEFKFLSFVSRCNNLGKCAQSYINPLLEARKTKLTWFKLLDNEMLAKSKSSAK